ncbi:MAG: DNA translocase FtsK [Clostridia bacterium]|nr:DNA translocase FtsK [Clostridia bacterium]
MATRKNNSTGTSNRSRGTSKGRASGKRASQTTLFDKNDRRTSILLSIISYAVGVCAILLLVLFIARMAGSDPWFGVICDVLYGFLSYAALTVPVMMIYSAFFLPRVIRKKTHIWNLILAVWLCMTLSVTVGLIHGIPEDLSLSAVYQAGVSHSGGGIIGGYFAWLAVKALSLPGAWILTLALIVAQIIFLIGLTLDDAWAFLKRLFSALRQTLLEKLTALKQRRKEKKERRSEEQNEEDEEDEEFVPPLPPEKGTKYYNKPHQDENPYADDLPKKSGTLPSEQISPLPEPEVIARPKGTPEGWNTGSYERAEKIRPKTETVSGSVDLDTIFSEEKKKRKKKEEQPPLIEAIPPEEPEELPPAEKKKDDPSEYAPTEKGEMALRRSQLISAVAPGKDEPEEPPKAYLFPPVSLLKSLPPEHDEDAKEELATNARRLVETLRSFKVRTKILDISRGPTITRYELQPEEGVRVRAIANLVDDISLNLASSGVRIEAPIPGKAAVGVEVPNKVRETVYLRTLIDDKRFAGASAKLTAAIGVDVGGAPVYVDLAKMPHLLIAGTTGSGKSVCLNCLILSMLYKASPDEVKMIMIDPKKVEFNVYNGLPHLIIPVVSNTKKAAGALSWAVSEMERRYELIETVGVRDIKSYNKITKNDPEKEYMPQLVIIIDELADLMMTAPGEVEESICRIAQKGRACGMHLIIGTQRPSVDVITGLIKANVPSRVAFTVSSQVDSRTIIDIAGAEKLIGRGDMLFAPIGAMKPVRLQGAFVSDEEVESVTQFIINNSAEAVYDAQVMKDIEKEAALCGSKKSKSSAAESLSEEEGGAEADPMLKAAIDLAVESGKISTSLIQRRLSLGYGRAAKLIDQMEKRGIVSPPEGQKPRTVLISAAEWQEICMQQEDGESEG